MKKGLLLLFLAALLSLGLYSQPVGSAEPDLMEMTVREVVVDPTSGAPLVVLQDSDKKKFVPIVIGINEAQAISMEMNKVTPVRPMTHDLIKSIIEKLQARLVRVVINDVRDNIIYALLYLRQDKGEVVIDSRPSDSIALALRVKAPIFVTKKVRDALAVEAPAPEKREPKGFSL